jgi:NAD(P)-dependent dehydrogenase (short-subunit alcohol dehydrogenase family)
MTLNGKVFVVTGGFGVLGRAVGVAAAVQGAAVALIDRAAAPDPVSLPEVLRGALLLGNVDLSSFESACDALDSVVQQCKGVDVLTNVAGAFRWQTLADGGVDTWDLLYTINLKTAVATSKAVLPHLHRRGGGHIINIGAEAAAKAGAGMGAYAASKAGVAKLTESLAEEVKDQGINVNAVLPSIIDTPANRADMPDQDFRRWISPDALADVIVFLASAEARAITGALISVSGRV